MSFINRIRRHPGVVTVVLVAAVVRLYGLRWGLPELFEEATPMRVAWGMWGWGERSFDPNPHFFNYPSLVIYLQFVGQAVLYSVMKSTGAIGSSLDFRALYATDKTAFVTTGRLITVLFSVATVGCLYGLVRRMAGRWAALVAAWLLAVNTLHIAGSQAIEVDVPLGFFVVASLWAMVALADSPTRRRYLIAGALVGLAASSKYTGAGLLLPLVVAHLLARRDEQGSARWSSLGFGVAAAAIAFFLTSPFVIIDMQTFLAHLSIERHHMQAGHFGLEGGASWTAYFRWLSGAALGWPTLLLAAAGLVVLAGVERRRSAIIVAAFLVPYALAVGSWSMRAERYLLPVLPVALVFGAALLPSLARVGPMARVGNRARTAALAVALIAMIAPLAAGVPAHLERYRPDPRTLAREWIEKNVQPGSFVVTEPYGPHLYGPYVVWRLDDDVRRRVFRSYAARPYYAVQELPMYQVDPERSGVFYDLDVLGAADIIVTTATVRARYERDPARFSRPVAFYHNLENEYNLIAQFDGGDGIRVYRSRVHERPFAERGEPDAPPPLQEGLEAAPGAQERFYFQLGINHEAFNHYAAAYQCYEKAFRYSMPTPVLFADVTISMARCLGAMGQQQMAIELLGRVESAAASDRERGRIRRFRETLMRSSGNTQRQ